MLYTPAVNKALKLCAKLHTDQTDKNDVLYFAHPFHIAEQMDSEAEICAALLHDILEDSTFTSSELLARGIPEAAVNAIMLLTHDEGILYLDYIRAIKEGDYGTKKPINAHNSTLDRLYATSVNTPFFNPLQKTDNDPIAEGARIARKVKRADLAHNSELGRLSIVSSRDIKRLKKYREAQVILGDLVYKARTPFGSFSVTVNDTPYAFRVETSNGSSLPCVDTQVFLTQPNTSYHFKIDVAPLQEGDLIEAHYHFGDKILSYESNNDAVCTTYKKNGQTISFSALTKNKYAYSEQVPFQLISRMGGYKIVNDPIKFRHYPQTHTIEYHLFWRE